MTEQQRKSQRGFTLVELMISLVLFSFAIAGVLSVAVTITRAFREQRRVIATENAARAPLDFVVDAVRQASPGVPTGTITDAETCATGAITITDYVNQPDELNIVYASGGVLSTSHTDFDIDSTEIQLPAIHAAEFSIGDYFVITDTAVGTVLKVTGTTTNTLQFADPTCHAGDVGKGGIIVRVQRAHFTVGTFDGISTLLMDPDGTGPGTAEPLSEGVEDFQVALAIDADGDGSILETADGSLDEWVGNNTGDTLLTGPLRALRIAIVARENTEQMGGNATNYRPTVLNRAGAASGEEDRYRRRVLSSTAEIRNLLGSP